MAKYGVYFKEDGTLGSRVVYTEQELPHPDHYIPGCTIVTFDETTEDYGILYGLFVEDPDKQYSQYLPAELGGVAYDFNTKTFSFVIPDARKSDILAEVRAERKNLLASTDDLALIPDLPTALKTELLNYRQALRDITKTIDPESTTFSDVVWPELPVAFRPARYVPS